MHKRIFIALAIFSVLALFTGAFLYSSSDENTDKKGYSEKVVIINSYNEHHVIMAELADTPAEWEIGLMFRHSMPQNSGMLFLMDDGVKTFWMNNTYIPLDILFIDKNNIIRTIHKGAVPQTLTNISSIVPVTTVLEINAGMADKLSIHEGDKVMFNAKR